MKNFFVGLYGEHYSDWADLDRDRPLLTLLLALRPRRRDVEREGKGECEYERLRRLSSRRDGPCDVSRENVGLRECCGLRARLFLGGEGLRDEMLRECEDDEKLEENCDLVLLTCFFLRLSSLSLSEGERVERLRLGGGLRDRDADE